MRILIVNFEYPPLGGGGGVATKQYAEELSKRPFDGAEGKHEVHVLTSAYKDLPRVETKGNLHIHRVPVGSRTDLATAPLLSLLLFAPAAFWRGLVLCWKTRFDVINAQFVVPSGVPAVFLSLVFRIPLVVSFVGADIYDPTRGISPHRHWYMRALIRWIARRSAALTAISEDTKRRARELHSIKKEITVTHLGFTPASTAIASRQELGLSEDTPILVSVGRLIPRKGYDVLLKAVSQLKALDYKLVIIGDGPLKEDLKRQIDELGLSNKVELTGFVSEEKKYQLLQAADIYVSAALHEGFGIVFLEAMSVGLPIVAPNDGGQCDFLQEGRNALLVAPQDPNALAAAIERLLSDSQLRLHMSQSNKQDAQKFTLENTTKQFEQVLTKVYENRH